MGTRRRGTPSSRSCVSLISLVLSIRDSQLITFGALSVLYSAAYGMAYSPLITSYTLEILPFNLRAKGYTVFGFSVCASLVFNQYINPIALAAIAWKYYIVYCVWIAFELVFVYFFLIETKNRTLEETALYVSSHSTYLFTCSTQLIRSESCPTESSMGSITLRRLRPGLQSGQAWKELTCRLSTTRKHRHLYTKN